MIFAGASNVPVTGSVIQGITALVGDSEIIGISSMSRGSARAKALIGGLRPLGRLIVWGGMHPTLFPEDCIGHADIVCRGEGEEFMLEIADRVSSGRDWRDIPNGAYLSEGRTILNELRPLIADLDDLPLLDFAFENEYILDPTGKLIPNTRMKEMKSVLFSGSRGCNNNCAYCSNSQLKSIYRGKGQYLRKMSIPRFVEVAVEYRRLFPRATRFYFTDEDFFARSVDNLKEFAESYPAQVGIPFECMASPNQITEEKVALASKAGMFQIDIGIESGSERIRRELFHRQVDDETQKQAAIAVNRYAPGQALYFLILGNPYEERRDLLDGVRLMEQLPPPFSLRTYNLVFIPGTGLFERAIRDGIIKGIGDSAFEIDFIGFDHGKHDWKRKNLYLNGLLYLMNGKFSRGLMGSVPRRFIPFLTSPGVVGFCDRHTRIGETMVALVNLRTGMRRAAANGPVGNLYRYTLRLLDSTPRSSGPDPVDSTQMKCSDVLDSSKGLLPVFFYMSLFTIFSQLSDLSFTCLFFLNG